MGDSQTSIDSIGRSRHSFAFRWRFANVTSVAVYTGNLLEAAAAGVKQMRETEIIGHDGVEDLTVDTKTTTSHKVPLFKLQAWLESSGRAPREGALKSKLR